MGGGGCTVRLYPLAFGIRAFLLLHIYILISILAAALWRVAILLQILTGLAKSWWAQLMNSASRTATEWKREVERERERPSRCCVCQLQLAAGGTRAFAGSQRGVWLLLISYYVQAQAVFVFAICNKCQLKWYLASGSILHQAGEEQLNSSARRAKWGWPWAGTWQFGSYKHITSKVRQAYIRIKDHLDSYVCHASLVFIYRVYKQCIMIMFCCNWHSAPFYLNRL